MGRGEQAVAVAFFRRHMIQILRRQDGETSVSFATVTIKRFPKTKEPIMNSSKMNVSHWSLRGKGWLALSGRNDDFGRWE